MRCKDQDKNEHTHKHQLMHTRTHTHTRHGVCVHWLCATGYCLANKEINDSTHSECLKFSCLLAASPFPSSAFYSHFHFGHYKLWSENDNCVFTILLRRNERFFHSVFFHVAVKLTSDLKVSCLLTTHRTYKENKHRVSCVLFRYKRNFNDEIRHVIGLREGQQEKGSKISMW